jgi:8-oxo-dGTP pyrophosphatase MutT (NUDIX family)
MATIKNAVIIPVYQLAGKTFVYMIVERRRNQFGRYFIFGNTGGKLEKGESPFQGALREFREETGFKCPDLYTVNHLGQRIRNMNSFDSDETRIYYGNTDNPDLFKFNRKDDKFNHETVGGMWVSLDDLAALNFEDHIVIPYNGTQTVIRRCSLTTLKQIWELVRFK